MNDEEKTLGACCMPDYEAEYPRLVKENGKLWRENERLRNTIVEMCKQLFGKGGVQR